MKVFGTTYDQDGTLPTANITVVDNPSISTASDENGEFLLDDSSIKSATKIKISYVGYNPMVLKASELQGKSVNLDQSIEALDEVIVTGQRPAKTISAISENKIITHIKKNKVVYGIGSALLLLAVSVAAIKKFA